MPSAAAPPTDRLSPRGQGENCVTNRPPMWDSHRGLSVPPWTGSVPPWTGERENDKRTRSLVRGRERERGGERRGEGERGRERAIRGLARASNFSRRPRLRAECPQPPHPPRPPARRRRHGPAHAHPHSERPAGRRGREVGERKGDGGVGRSGVGHRPAGTRGRRACEGNEGGRGEEWGSVLLAGT